MHTCTVNVVCVSNLKSWRGSATWLIVSDKTATYLQSIKGDSDLNHRSVRYSEKEFKKAVFHMNTTINSDFF